MCILAHRVIHPQERGIDGVAADAVDVRVAPVSTEHEAKSLATVLLNNMALPPNAVDDAAHIAVAAVNQMEYLLTWNCRHIANATMRPKREHLCLAEGYRCPIICTPHELRRTKHEN